MTSQEDPMQSRTPGTQDTTAAGTAAVCHTKDTRMRITQSILATSLLLCSALSAQGTLDLTLSVPHGPVGAANYTFDTLGGGTANANAIIDGAINIVRTEALTFMLRTSPTPLGTALHRWMKRRTTTAIQFHGAVIS